MSYRQPAPTWSRSSPKPGGHVLICPIRPMHTKDLLLILWLKWELCPHKDELETTFKREK